MFDDVAPRYDLMNDVLSFGLTPAWRAATTRAIDPQPGELILDLAAGTGSSGVPLASGGARVIAADLSIGMLRVGRNRAPQLDFLAANALELPFQDDVFDAVTMSFGLRNVPDVALVLAELRRVTKPGGRLVICEFSHPNQPGLKQLYPFYLRRVMPLISKFASNPDSYGYLGETILAWPDQEQLACSISAAGWSDVEYRNLSGGLVALHRGVANGTS